MITLPEFERANPKSMTADLKLHDLPLDQENLHRDCGSDESRRIVMDTVPVLKPLVILPLFQSSTQNEN